MNCGAMSSTAALRLSWALLAWWGGATVLPRHCFRWFLTHTIFTFWLHASVVIPSGSFCACAHLICHAHGPIPLFMWVISGHRRTLPRNSHSPWQWSYLLAMAWLPSHLFSGSPLQTMQRLLNLPTATTLWPAFCGWLLEPRLHFCFVRLPSLSTSIFSPWYLLIRGCLLTYLWRTADDASLSHSPRRHNLAQHLMWGFVQSASALYFVSFAFLLFL